MWRSILTGAAWLTCASLILASISMEYPMADDQKSSQGTVPEKETATLGGGCFWCLEAVFEEMEGVKKVVSGYAGGSRKNPTYQQVSSGATGHAEVVQIEFDPGVVTYASILSVFFTIHDPTTLDRQGADEGSQYRSVIFYHDDRQEQAAKAKIAEIESARMWKRPVVTEVVPFKAFYEAEEYHQEYFKKNPEAGYCRAVVAPKVMKFRESFPDNLKK